MLTTLDSVELANQLRPVLLQLNRHLRRELAPLGITAGQAALLHVIRTTPGVGVRALAAHEGISTPAMSRLHRPPRGCRPGRPRALGRRIAAASASPSPTPALRALRSARSRRTAWLAHRLKRLTDAERAAIAAALEPLALLLAEDGA